MDSNHRQEGYKPPALITELKAQKQTKWSKWLASIQRPSGSKPVTLPTELHLEVSDIVGLGKGAMVRIAGHDPTASRIRTARSTN